MTDLDMRRYHLNRRDELASVLGQERFKVLGPYLRAPELLNWVARNALATKGVLATPYVPVNDTVQLRKAMDDFEFHFRNFSASIVGTVAALFAWAKESEVAEIDGRVLRLKKSAHIEVMNCLRSRLMHGGRVFGSFGSRMNLGGPMRGHFQYTSRLVDAAMADLRGLPNTTKELVERMQSAIGEETDWVTPFANGVLSEMQDAWKDSELLFRERFAEIVRERERIMMEIAIHEHELEKDGFFDPIRPNRKT